MSRVISDYRKTVWLVPLRWWMVTAIELAVYLLTGVFRSEGLGRVFAVICTALFVLMSAYITLNVLIIEPRRFKKRMSALTANEQNAVFEQYEKAAMLGRRHFLDEYLICFQGMSIVLVKFSEIRSAELKGYKLLLDVGEKKPLKMPFDVNENPAILVAAMRSRNPNISVILNGRVVEKMENGKEKPRS